MNLVKLFAEPRMEYRAKPFWAWNGELEKEELLRQIDNAKKMGFGGFFMHSRTGLATKYLGEEWFELTNACADYAKELGMEAWLYDEDRWPSGTAGGVVTMEPKNRMRHIRMIRKVKEVTQEILDGTLAAFVIEEKEDVLKQYTRIFQVEEQEHVKGELILFIEEEMEKSSFYNGYTYADTLNEETTQCYLESTHAKYIEKCGERIGDSIMGIFTDEPHRGGLMTSFGQGAESSELNIPYTGSMPKSFEEKYGYDMIACLPELFLCKNTEKVAKIKWQYVKLVQEMFLENYAIPINNYCKQNGMILTGHILHENNLTSQTAMSGSMMRYYEHMENPGIDFLGEFDHCYWIAKQLQSVARQLGKKFLLSELDGCTGWQMKLENYKAIGDWQALYGINVRCPHLSWYTMEGQAKRDYPASIFHQSTWWEEYAYLEDYYARIGEFMAVGVAKCEVLVLNPVESFWAQIHPLWCEGLAARDEHLKDLEQQYADTFYWLQQAHIDFDYGDEGMLSTHGRVENGKMIIGNSAYETVVISGMDTIRGTTVKLLKEFTVQGGKVVVCGNVPTYQDCEPLPWDVESSQVPYTRDKLTENLSNYALSIVKKDGSNATDILCQINTQGDTTYLMMINDNRQEGVFATLRIPSEGVVTRFIPETGAIEEVKSKKDGVFTVVDIEMEAVGSMLLTIGESFTKQKEEKKQKANHSVKLTGAQSFTLDEPNICVLDMASVSVNGNSYTKKMEILKADCYVRTQYGLAFRGGEMLQPWFVKQKKVEAKGTVRLQFAFDIETLPEQDLLLVLESPEHVSLRCNKKELTYIPNDFYWADKCYKSVKVPKELLKIGKNVIATEQTYFVTTNLETMFLFGDFGVRLLGAKRVLTTLPKKLNFGDIVSQGLPFYSGKLTYHCKLSKEVTGSVKVAFEELNSACIKIEGNGKEKIVAFRPYEAEVTDLLENEYLNLTAVLTRRNTFGPLHELPIVAPYCAPDSFETEGDKFNKGYSLFAAGIIKAPTITFLT